MKVQKCFKHAFEMVLHSKLRSWLTILGIVIGVAAVIAIVSIGAGMQQAMNSRLSGLGGDIITVNPGHERGGGFFGGGGGGAGGGGSTGATTKAIVLNRNDIQALKGVSDIAVISPQIRGSVNVSYLGKSGKVSITGIDQKVWSKITTSTLSQGRLLDSADQNVIVIGGGLSSSYFSKPLGINQMLNIQGSSFRVVGILNDTSNSIYMPIDMAFQVIPDKANGEYDSISLKIKNQDNLDADLTKITDTLMLFRHVTSRTLDFSVTSSKEMQATREQAMSSISLFLIAIAGVSLLVGAVGVANTMFTSVLEKTKDIGIMKAIGARNKDILLIFLFHAALIGLIGGLIGVFFGVLLSGLMPAIFGGGFGGGGAGATTLVSWQSIVMALSVSVSVGIAAGIIPAYQASKLKPVDALRYE